VELAVDFGAAKVTDVSKQAINKSVDASYEDPNGSCTKATRWFFNE